LQLSHALAVKLPTGSVARGWSNGGVDVALGMIAAWQSKAWATHIESWWTHPLKRQDLGYSIRDYVRNSLSLGYSALYPIEATWLVGVQGGTSPYKTGVNALDQDPWLMSAGMYIKTETGSRWKFSFTENLTQSSTQDFGVSLEIQVPLY